MANRYGPTSRRHRLTLHPDLQRLFDSVLKFEDHSLLCGYRGPKEQARAYKGGRSNAEWPYSNHNSYPSRAVDVAPWPIDWRDEERFVLFAGRVQGHADVLGIEIRWGGKFEGLRDLGHFELI